MGNLQLLPNLTSQFLSEHPIEFGCSNRRKQVIDHLIDVDVEHMPRTWGKEVCGTDIGIIFHHVSKQLSLAAKKRSHLVCHIW
jgi:hypothetical protein